MMARLSALSCALLLQLNASSEPAKESLPDASKTGTQAADANDGKSDWIEGKNILAKELVWIEPGSFVMGSARVEMDRDNVEGPQTKVTISHGFWMGVHEVTQKEYTAVMGKNPSAFKGELLPVEQVSWFQATNYCVRLTSLEWTAGRLPRGYIYRLPTEAEWEYACRAGTSVNLRAKSPRDLRVKITHL